MLVAGIQQSDSDINIDIDIAIDFFFRLFSIMVYYRILNILG